MASQIGFSCVQVSWTAPPAPPTMGYHITTHPGDVNVTAPSSPHNISNLQPGLYNIHVMSLSQHYPGGTVGPVNVTVEGEVSFLDSKSYLW